MQSTRSLKQRTHLASPPGPVAKMCVLRQGIIATAASIRNDIRLGLGIENIYQKPSIIWSQQQQQLTALRQPVLHDGRRGVHPGPNLGKLIGEDITLTKALQGDRMSNRCGRGVGLDLQNPNTRPVFPKGRDALPNAPKRRPGFGCGENTVPRTGRPLVTPTIGHRPVPKTRASKEGLPTALV